MSSYGKQSRRYRPLYHYIIVCPLVLIIGFLVYRECGKLWSQTELKFEPEIQGDVQPALAAKDNLAADNFVQSVDPNLVQITVYYETLCPDCRRFITTMLFPTFKKVGSIMDLKIIPYGHAHETKEGDQWLFRCQHGPPECEGNIIHTCAMDIVKDINIYMPFVNCMETRRGMVTDAARECGKQFNLPIDDILACSVSPHGNQLQHGMAQQTESLNPKLTWVPWITLAGVHTADIQKQAERDLLKLVCDNYKGSKPDACSR